MRRRWLLIVGGVVPLLLGVAPLPAAAAPTVTIVATGFDNPRGIAFAGFRLLVGEAGTGGDVCNPAEHVCVGLTGKISELHLWGGGRRTIASGLISVSEFGDVIGVGGVSSSEGQSQAIIGGFPQAAAGFDCTKPGMPADCAAVKGGALAQLGQLIRIKWHGYQTIAGVGASDFEWTVKTPPAGQDEQDSNPYGVLVSEDGTWVADAGSNVLVWVDEDGGISRRQWFGPPAAPPPPGFPHDAVPTCVAHRNGGLFVGDLAGRGWQGNANGRGFNELNLHGTGKHITGCTTDTAGNVLFVNMGDGTFGPGTGSVVKLDRAGKTSVLVDHLNYPNMITQAHQGDLYVTINSTCPAQGGTRSCTGKSGAVVRIAYSSREEED